MPKQPIVDLHLRLPPHLARQLAQLAAANRRSQNAEVAVALETWVEHQAMHTERDGSIFERPERPMNSRWCGVVDLGVQGGKRRRKYVYGATRRVVQQQIAELRRQRSNGVPVAPRRESLAVFLDRWFATLKPRPQGRYSPTTLKGYADVIRVHLKPRLGDVRVADLNADHVQDLQEGMLADGLASQTVLNVRNILRGAIRHAMRQRLLAYNPIELVEAPPASRGTGQAIEPEGAGRFLAMIKGHRLEAAFLMELALGCQRSEVLGLEWDAVDLRPGQERVHIRQGLHRVKGLGIVVLGPKSLRGNRTLALPKRLAALLRQRQRQQEDEQIAAAEHWRNTRADGTQWLVFTTVNGNSIEPSRFSNAIKTVLRSAGLGHLRGHDLRHSASSILQALGLPPLAAMEVLGHSSPDVTMGIYGHLLSSSRRQAATLMDRYLDQSRTGDRRTDRNFSLIGGNGHPNDHNQDVHLGRLARPSPSNSRLWNSPQTEASAKSWRLTFPTPSSRHTWRTCHDATSMSALVARDTWSAIHARA